MRKREVMSVAISTQRSQTTAHYHGKSKQFDAPNSKGKIPRQELRKIAKAGNTLLDASLHKINK